MRSGKEAGIMNMEMDAMLDQAVEEVFAVLRRDGLVDLSKKRWDDLEEPAVEIGDRVTQKILAKLLGQQAEDLQEHGLETCCRCGTKLDDPPVQSRTLVTRRGKVHWKTPVQYCAACRRDFFPSGEGTGD
jgi:hypothetical protein